MSGHVVVAGAGAVGSTIAYVLARAGCRVTLADPAAPAANASGIAAGMLAPGFECVFDQESAGRFALFAEARDRWPTLAAEIDLPLDRPGAMAVGERGEVLEWTRRLTAAGAAGRTMAPDQVADASPGLPQGSWGAFYSGDWRLDARAALARLRLAAEHHGARFVTGAVSGFDAGKVHIHGHRPLAAETLVIATGAGQDLAQLAPELTTLTAIKGHILRAAADVVAGPVLRVDGAYLCQGGGEVILGATMEAGHADSAVDQRQVDGLKARAAPLIERLGPVAWRPAAGVRAATADGLPLAGLARGADVILAVGARRNGWLLAPLIAEAVLAAWEGRRSTGSLAAFDPGRFKSPG